MNTVYKLHGRHYVDGLRCVSLLLVYGRWLLISRLRWTVLLLRWIVCLLRRLIVFLLPRDAVTWGILARRLPLQLPVFIRRFGIGVWFPSNQT